MPNADRPISPFAASINISRKISKKNDDFAGAKLSFSYCASLPTGSSLDKMYPTASITSREKYFFYFSLPQIQNSLINSYVFLYNKKQKKKLYKNLNNIAIYCLLFVLTTKILRQRNFCSFVPISIKNTNIAATNPVQ